MIELDIATPDDMRRLGARIGRMLRAGDLVALDGPLGAGKTTLTRGLGEELGVRGTITSPTFVLARTHPRAAGAPPLVHVDAYRLGSAAELDDLDLDIERSIVVVEWAAGMVDGLTDSVLAITIARPTGAVASALSGDGGNVGDGDGDGGGSGDNVDELIEPRVVRIEGHGPRWDQLDRARLG